MKLINLFGGPGSGKSTTAAGLFYKMKLQHKNVELITEYAKDLVYSEILPIVGKNSQEFIFAEQNRRQQILEGKVDWAITDSPLLLSFFYGVGNGRVNEEAFLSMVSDTFRMYDNINIFLDRPTQFSEIGRSQNLQQSIEVDEALLKVLAFERVEFVRIPADSHTIERIMAHLM